MGLGRGGLLLLPWIAAASWLAAFHPAAAGAPTTIRVTTAPTLSPDGQTLAFEWIGDLWTAPSAGGLATRVVSHPGRDAYPRFSPDGKRIVFSSDRSGSMQVWSVPAGGGEAVRHTHHSEGNELECLSPDGSRALVRGLRERAGLRSLRLMEIDLRRDARERRIFDATAHSPAWSPDGRTLLFCRGGEQLYRQGYLGPRASRIWSFHPADRSFRCEVDGDFEARWPMWLPDGSGFYYVSNQTGVANLWLRKQGAAPAQATFYQNDTLVTPDLSADGSTLVFRQGSGLFRLRPGVDPQPVEIQLSTHEPVADRLQESRAVKRCAAADFTADGRQVVFAATGELWWIPAPGKSAQQVTTTPEAEEEPRFSPDGSWLYFLRDDGVDANYHRARFGDGKLLDSAPVTTGPGSKRLLTPSPDGAWIAWFDGAGHVVTARADGGETRQVFRCRDVPDIEWSPDGTWLALAARDRNSNRDILLVHARGGAEPVNLTRHPGFETGPKWSLDGRWLVFRGRRDRSGEMALWKIDLGRATRSKEVDPQAFMAAGDRARVVPTGGIEPIRVVWSADSKRLLFQSANSSTKRLFAMDVDGSDRKTLADRRGIPLRMTADGVLLWICNGTPERRMDGNAARFPIDMTVRRPRSAALSLAFRRIWRTLGERFHDPRMNGRDWPAMLRKYEPLAAGAADAKQFDVAVSRLLGELNASHLSFLHDGWPDDPNNKVSEKKTAHPGIEWDDAEAPADSPLRIARVLAGSPAAALPDAPQPGETVVRIGGRQVTHGSPLHELLDGMNGSVLPMVLRDAAGRERTVAIRAISYKKARWLDGAERLENHARQVAAAIPGACYVKVPDMDRASLDHLQLTIHRAAESSTRLVLDLRDNNGGREADRMLHLFADPRNFTTTHRDGAHGYPLDRLHAPPWPHPMVVLCNAHTYSNSEIFCHAIQRLGRAPLVGTATAGGVISAVKARIPEAGSLQVPFRSWFHAENGRSLELEGARPDHPVALTPADEDAGRDPQIQMAIAILRQSPAAGPPPPAWPPVTPAHDGTSGSRPPQPAANPGQ